MWPRHQLAAYSPIPVSAIAQAAAAGLGFDRDPRGALIELLGREYDAARVVLCGSGTQSLQLAITIGMRRGGSTTTVALPAFSCFDVASAAVGADARVACYDVDPNTLAPDLDSFERVLRGGARAVVVAPLYGVPVPWDEIQAIAERHGALLIEDAAQGHGATWRGRMIGTLASISILSFGRGKGWTGGEGGALLLRGALAREIETLPLPRLAREAATSAALVVQWALGRPSVYGIPRSIPALTLGETRYREPKGPRSMTRAAAAAALRGREQSQSEARVRRANANAILDAVSHPSGLQPIKTPEDATAGYLRLPILVRGGASVALSRPELERLGVTASYPMPLFNLPALHDRLVTAGEHLPGAKSLSQQLITLPTHSQLESRERNRLVSILLSATQSEGCAQTDPSPQTERPST